MFLNEKSILFVVFGKISEISSGSFSLIENYRNQTVLKQMDCFSFANLKSKIIFRCAIMLKAINIYINYILTKYCRGQRRSFTLAAGIETDIEQLQ